MESALRRSAIYRYARFFFLKGLTVTTGSVKTPENGRFRLPRSFNPEAYWGLLRGRYEQAESEILRSDFAPDALIIELGSNIGFIARQASAKVKPNGTLVCVEANPETLPFLETNLADARKRHSVHIVAAAIGAPESQGERGYFQQRRDLGSSLGEVAVHQRDARQIQVEVRSLSSVVEEFDPDCNGYSLICDAEGAEILILTKDAVALSRCRQIAIELHGPSLTGSDITPDDMVRMIEGMGFVRGRVIREAQQATYYFSRP